MKRSAWKRKRKVLAGRQVKALQGDLFENYSDHVLSQAQQSLLNKGPNFCPTRPKVNKTEVKVSNFKWSRNMQWRQVFHGKDEEGDKEESDEVPNILKKASEKCNLPKGTSMPSELKNCIAATTYDILSLNLRPYCSNLSKEERQALEELKELQKERKLVIKRSDKKGGWVITNFKVYQEEGDKKLKETFIDENGDLKPKYKEVNESVLKKQHKDLVAMAREGVEQGYICAEDGNNMVTKEPKAGRMYMNSKNHKPVDPETGVPPWREIVGGSGSQTEGASKIVNYFLNPINMKVASYLEDSRDMLAKVKVINETQAPLPAQSRMVTPDVTAMYPSIPPDGGVAPAGRALLREGLVRLLRLVLEYNVFEWNGKLYQQLFGTAIGTSCAPPYSGLFLEEVTLKAFRLWELAHPDPDHNLREWSRFIDDGWGLWNGPLQLLQDFLFFLNTQVRSIKFTMSYSCPRESCPEAGVGDHECKQFEDFLDLKMFIDHEGKIQTDVNTKEGMKCQYLSPASAHPRHIFSNIPKLLVHRVVRICSVEGLRTVRLEEQRLKLRSRGYNAGELRKAVEFG